MARAPDARAGQALGLYREGRKIAEISGLLGIPEGTLRSWKKRYHWDGKALQKKACGVAKERDSVAKKRGGAAKEKGGAEKGRDGAAKKRGGQPGNRNAAGHGGTGPPGNKNAVTTGEFESLFFDTMDQEEKELLGLVQPDKGELILQELRLLTVRERRMLKRLASLAVLEDKAADAPEVLGALQDRQQDVEEALTRVQAVKKKAIDSLHKYSYDDALTELKAMSFDLALQKQGGQEEKAGDDGFMEAMNAAAVKAWEDGE